MDETTDRGSQGRGVGCDRPKSAKEWLARYLALTNQPDYGLDDETETVASLGTICGMITARACRAELTGAKASVIPERIRQAITLLCESWLALDRERQS